MNTIKNYFFLFIFPIFLVSADIEEIVVQGDWRQSKLIEEDSSVLVLTTKELESAPIKHFENLSYLIPNLNFAASDSRARHFQIRGIGERSGYERTPNSAVGFLIDDIDYSDVDQIEVHRGPQGSRIGSNAMAGLIYIKTKEPTEVFEGISEITTGTYGTLNSGVAFGGPSQIDDLTYRIALRKDYSDGFRKNLFSGKSDTSKKDESTFRLKANWKVNAKSTLKVLVTQINLDDPADIWTIDGSLNTLSNRPGMDSQKTNAYGIKFFHIKEDFEFQSLTSMTDTDVVLSYDADWGNPSTHLPYIYDYFSETLRFRETFSQEFRLLSTKADFNSNKRYEWVVGMNFFESNEKNLKKR
jgi:iron complex outermembrane receptor protein